MKKILNFLGVITLIGTSIASLVACNTKYNKTELKEQKKQNKINNKEIRDNLEWMAPQEKPFKQVDNKWYFAVWRSNESDDWRIIKFNNSNLQKIVLDKYNEYDFYIGEGDLHIYENKFPYRGWPWNISTSGRRFKSVYRWDKYSEPNTLIIDPKTGEVADRKEVKEDK